MQTSSTLILTQFTICCAGINLAGGGGGGRGTVRGKTVDVNAGNCELMHVDKFCVLCVNGTCDVI